MLMHNYPRGIPIYFKDLKLRLYVKYKPAMAVGVEPSPSEFQLHIS